MCMHDPIADMLTRIRNAQGAKLQLTSMSSSKLKEQIAQVLKDEGYINNFSVTMNEKGFKILDIDLKYYHGKAVIERIKRVSRPGLRIYKACKDLNPIPGFGIVILSTSRGVMSNLEAKAVGVGGELLCEVA